MEQIELISFVFKLKTMCMKETARGLEKKSYRIKIKVSINGMNSSVFFLRVS